MKVIRGLNSLSAYADRDCVATIGNFDGLHLGHQKIINKLKEKAKELDLPLTVISFEPLPAEFFMQNPPARIYPMRDKVRLLNALGVDQYICLRFDETFATIAPEIFVQSVLLDKLSVKYLAVGDDFRFGHKRKGDFQLLKEMGEKSGMQVSDTQTCEFDDERVSSTRIRRLLEAGKIQAANSLLGFNYQLSGRVRQGDKRGRTIGFPTLNMRMLSHIAPAKGVYVVKAYGLGNTPLYGVSNLGTRPTVNGTENRLETHLFDFNKDVYGNYVCIEPLHFLREEKKFDNFDALKIQIQHDVQQAKKYLQKAGI